MRYFQMRPFPQPPASLLFMNFWSEKQKIFSSCIFMCNILLALWSFSKPMLTCICCGLKLSSMFLGQWYKLRKKILNQWNSSAPSPLLPLLSTTGANTQNVLFLPSPVCLAFILRQSNAIPVHKPNASNKPLVGDRLLASVEGSQRQPDCIIWLHRLQGGTSFLSFYCSGCFCLKPCGTWKCGLLTSLSFCDCRSAVQPFFLLVWPGWHRKTCFSWVTLGLNNLQFCLSPDLSVIPRFAAWSLPSDSGHGSMGNSFESFPATSACNWNLPNHVSGVLANLYFHGLVLKL